MSSVDVVVRAAAGGRSCDQATRRAETDRGGGQAASLQERAPINRSGGNPLAWLRLFVGRYYLLRSVSR
jgi:hypothetical protein